MERPTREMIDGIKRHFYWSKPKNYELVDELYNAFVNRDREHIVMGKTVIYTTNSVSDTLRLKVNGTPNKVPTGNAKTKAGYIVSWSRVDEAFFMSRD